MNWLQLSRQVNSNVMVAARLPASERFIAPPQPVLTGRSRLVQFTRHDAAELLRLGIIPEDASTELLNGLVVLADRSEKGGDVLMIGKSHRIVVERLSNLRIQLNSNERHVETQQPLVCSEMHVPQPDFMIIRGQLDDYTDLPTASEAFCVIEVADSSYERDAGEKLTGYAKAAVNQYIILNLRNNTAEVHENPDIVAGVFTSSKIVPLDGALSLQIGNSATFDLPLLNIFD